MMKRNNCIEDARRLSRRRFIRTAGVTITLPMLPSLLWSPRAAKAQSCNPKRFLAYMFGNGTHKPEFIPPGSGSTAMNVSGDAWQLPTPLASMQELKQDLVFVSGLENQERRRAPGDHGIGCGSLLTARMPTANQTYTSMSVDQAIADAIQEECPTGIHSLQLGTHSVGYHDSWGTFYTQNISWRGPAVRNPDGTMSFPVGDATPLGKENDPRAAFDRMFAGVDPNASAAEAAMRRAMRKSVLDTVVPHGDALRNRLNPADQAKLDELFTGIRALEREIDATPGASCVVPDRPPQGLTANAEFRQQLDVMHDLMVIAFQCDITRVITFMQTDPISDRNFSFIPGVTGAGGVNSDHAMSHHSGNPEMIEQFRAMVRWKMERIAGFLQKMKSATDFDGQPLLDNSLVWISSEIADGDAHDHQDMRLMVAGKLGGLVTTDRHVRFPPGGWRDYNGVKTFGDFFITLLDLYGVQTMAFGNDGQEAITWHR